MQGNNQRGRRRRVNEIQKPAESRAQERLPFTRPVGIQLGTLLLAAAQSRHLREKHGKARRSVV